MIIPLIIWVAIAFVALVILLWFFPVTLWFQAILSGVHLLYPAGSDALERCKPEHHRNRDDYRNKGRTEAQVK